MNIIDEIGNIRRWLAELNRLLLQTRGAGGVGEANTASNQGAGGVGLFNAKVGIDLQFRNINAASNKVTVALDAPNKEVDIDLDETKIDHDNLLNYVAAQHIDWTNAASNLKTSGTGMFGGTFLDATSFLLVRNAIASCRVRIEAEGTDSLAGLMLIGRDGGVDKTWYIDNRGGVDAPPNNDLRFYEPTATLPSVIFQAGAARASLVVGANSSIGIGTDSPTGNADMTLEGGVLCIKEAATPGADVNYGKFYTKIDNKIYFQDGAGVEHEIAYAGGAGEANTASNQGVGGVGLYDAKVGVDLQFRNINAASNKITVALDAPNKEVDIDVDPSKIDLGDLGDVSNAAPNDNDVLTWDAAGAQWQPEAPGAGGGAVNPMAFRRNAKCYTTWDYYTSTSFAAIRDKIYAYPFVVPVSQDFDRIICAVSGAQAGGVARIGIYEDNNWVYPGDLVVSSAEIDCSGAGYKPQVIAETLTPALYWLVIISDATAANITFRALDYNSTNPLGWFGILGKFDNNWVAPPQTHWSKAAHGYGALPDPFPAGASQINNENLITIMLRKT